MINQILEHKVKQTTTKKIIETPPIKALAARFGKLAACLTLGVATLSQTARSAPSYGTAALSGNPIAFWQLTETDAPSTGTVLANDSTGHGFNGTYGIDCLNGLYGIYAPQPPTFSGFTNLQGAAYISNGDTNSVVTLPPLNLSPEAVDTTIVMWINPAYQPPVNTGLLFDRSGSDASTAGFGFSGGTSGGLTSLGYTWNNTQASWGWNSQLYPPLNTWSFVALVVQSNQATIYLNYMDPNSMQPVLLSAVHANTHSPVAWNSGTIWLGGDSMDAARIFPGTISGAAIYNSALTQVQIQSLFAAGVGVSGFAPLITGQPRSQYVLSGSTAQLSATGINGSVPFSYQWQLNGTNVDLLANSANYTGAQSNVLTILNATADSAGSYHLIVTNAFGLTLSSNATLTLQSTNLVGEWLNGTAASTNLVDLSGYRPAGTHDGYIVGAGNYTFTNDVPPGKTGLSLLLYTNDTGIAIRNSSTVDASYTNSFDAVIGNAMTVAFWAKGYPGNWNPWVSKAGEGSVGWQLRDSGDNTDSGWTLRGTRGNVTLGSAVWGSPEDLRGTIPSNDQNWHFYVGTYDLATGVRNLYVDASLSGSETNNGPYGVPSAQHLCIGARDADGSTFAYFFTGQMFDVRVYNYALSASQINGLYGVNPPGITRQPLSVTNITGKTVQFSVLGSGTAPLSYQWQLNGTNVNLLPDSANFSGATSNVLTIASASAIDVGSYHVIVSNPYGSPVTSSNATLTLLPKLLLGQWFNGSASLADVSGYQPAGTHDGYVVGGVNYSFTADVPPGMTGQSLYLNGTDTAIAIANSSSTSDYAYTNSFDGTMFTVSFWAKGLGNNSTWDEWVSKGGDDGVGWKIGTEAWSRFLQFTMRGIDRGGITYTVGNGLWGNEILEAKNYPVQDGNWHFYACTYNASTGTRTIYYDGTLVDNQLGDAIYASAAALHLCIGGRESSSTGFGDFTSGHIFDVRFYNYDLAASEILRMMPDPVISTQPAPSLSTYVGRTVRLVAVAQTHSTPVTNQWQLNGTNLVNGAFGAATISGADSTTLTISNVTTDVQGVYRLTVSDPNGLTTSSNATITVVGATVPAPAANLVGAWITGATNLADTSGYSPAGTHDAYGVSGTGTRSSNYGFTNDVPPGMVGQSLTFRGNTALAISNSSTLDLNYTNTFDDAITNAMTVEFWAKGWPGGWNPFISKYGEGPGWELRNDGNNNVSPCWTVRGAGGAVTLGSAVYGNSADLAATSLIYGMGTFDSGSWHHYAGTFDAQAGVRSLYVDGQLVAQATGGGQYSLATAAHLCIGGRDANTGNSFGNYFTGQIFGVRIYNVALSEAQVNSLMLPTPAPAFSGPPVLSGNKFVLSWTGGGSLLQATNLAGPWTTVTGATSPFTNDVTISPQMFFKLSNQ